MTLRRLALLTAALLVPACGGGGSGAAGPPGGWTWLSGTATGDVNGTYGTIQVPSPANAPGGRSTGGLQVDSMGRILLFGGAGMASTGTWGYLNDLWRYDAGVWTWISGSNVKNQNGNYGTKGVAAPTNMPGGRLQFASTMDPAGNLWIFGGMALDSVGGFERMNDLWRWDGTNWTWVSGSGIVGQLPTYGVKGTPAPANIPGARAFPVLWSDALGRIWLFGGLGYDAAGTLNYLNDVWRFDGTNWAWIAGSNLVNQSGNYGVKGVPAASNTPGARSSPTAAFYGGTLRLFGGSGRDSVGTAGWLSDLWTWDGATWTWQAGPTLANQNGFSVGKGVTDNANLPGCRYGGAALVDNAGRFWLFGGFGISLAVSSGRLNDLWVWDAGLWTWVGGSNDRDYPGSFGTKGVWAATNQPAACDGPLFGRDAQGRMLLFGGYGPGTAVAGYMNDLWLFQP